MTLLDPAPPLSPPLSPPPTTVPSLATAMREGSRTEHEAAEGSSFMAELLAGRVDGAGYTAYLRRLRCVYEALETTARSHLDDPATAAVHDPALERLAALDADLAHWAPGTDPAAPVISPAATAYADRVRAAGPAGLLAAHHYTRYLGDLSGGQAIGRLLDREHGLDGRGLAFYDFAAVGKPKPYKDAYRARLDALGLPEPEQERVVAEVRVAFGLNQALFLELGADLPAWRRTPV